MMKKLKKYCLTGLFFLGFILLFSLILTTFNYFDILHFKLTNTFIFIGMILLLFIIGFEYGKKALKKGFLEGLKIGLWLIFILIFINIVFYHVNFSLERTIYYIVLILASTLGSMVGINKKG